MKKIFIASVFCCGLCFLYSPKTLFAQESLPESYYINIEFCYCGVSVIKCRPDGLANCEVSSQIPCGEACGD
jgi:Pyruvate/2-oxoacid:ferredoxin oxidoreductase delta subunit